MEIKLHHLDLAANVELGSSIAVDTESMGLKFSRDRLCAVQLKDEKSNIHIVHFPEPDYKAPILKKLFSDKKRNFIFHFARFDVAILYKTFGVMVPNIYCTKIASRLVRTYTDAHGLKDLCKDLIGVSLNKQQGQSDWGASKLTQEQLKYAATDVLHLHELRDTLNKMLEREGRIDLANRCFEFIPTRVLLDLAGWEEQDIFIH